MVLTGNLTHGHTTSCGCARGPGIVGRRFGGLIVTERIGKNKFRCRCDCGKVVRVERGNLVRGRTRSCGCLKHDYQNWNHGTATVGPSRKNGED